MEIKLLRLALLTYDSLPESLRSWKVNSGNIVVETLKAFEKDGRLSLLVAAACILRQPLPLTDEKILIVPEPLRKKLEYEIEKIANLISVTESKGRTISSPIPFVAFVPLDGEGKKFLQAVEGFDVGSLPIVPNRPHSSIQLQTAFNQVSDRMDGVALMAEAQSHTHTTGKFHEYMRVFERAFRTSVGKKLTSLLADYLSTANLGYSRNEIDEWVTLRPATAHAAMDRFHMESDTRPLIPRIEQAAYDVLFNKKEWRSKSIERREVIKILLGLGSQQGVFIQQGMAGEKLTFQVLDSFGAYPLNLAAGLEPIPTNWFVPQASHDTKELNFQVTETQNANESK